jgi:hypothetical protein
MHDLYNTEEPHACTGTHLGKVVALLLERRHFALLRFEDFGRGYETGIDAAAAAAVGIVLHLLLQPLHKTTVGLRGSQVILEATTSRCRR